MGDISYKSEQEIEFVSGERGSCNNLSRVETALAGGQRALISPYRVELVTCSALTTNEI